MYVYIILSDGEVIGLFNSEHYACDFVDYQETISDKLFVVEKVALNNWRYEDEKE